MSRKHSDILAVRSNIRKAHREGLKPLRDHSYKLYKELGGTMTLSKIIKNVKVKGYKR